jgi:hypothetical protein
MKAIIFLFLLISFSATAQIKPAGVNSADLFRILDADATGSDVATAQPWFPSTGAVSVEASTTYIIWGWFSSARTAGATSHTTNLLFGGTATITSLNYWVEVKEGDAATIADSDLRRISGAGSTNIKAASTSTTENIVFGIWGILRVNAAGTFTPQFIYSAAPGGAPTIHNGTHFGLTKIASNTTTTIGPWQ